MGKSTSERVIWAPIPSIPSEEGPLENALNVLLSVSTAELIKALLCLEENQPGILQSALDEVVEDPPVTARSTCFSTPRTLPRELSLGRQESCVSQARASIGLTQQEEPLAAGEATAGQVGELRPTEVPRAAIAQSSSQSKFINGFIEVPKPETLASDLVLDYVGLFGNISVLITSIVSRRWFLCCATAGSMTIPGVVHACNIYFVLSIVNPKLSMREKLREAVLAVISMNRTVEAYRYFKGTEPIWSLLVKDRLGTLTLCNLPAFAANLADLLTDSVPPGWGRFFLSCNTITQVVCACQPMYMLHTSYGPPGNMQKYRLWNVEENAVFHVIMVQLIDISQVWYRLVMFGFVAAFAGAYIMFGIVFASCCFTAAFARIGLSVVPAYGNGWTATLMSLITGLENVLFDYPWLEPVPAYSFYIDVCFPFRVLQALACAWVIATHWDASRVWNTRAFYLSGGSGALMALLYFTAYPLYVYHLTKNRAIESSMKRDEFVASMFRKRFDRQTTAAFDRVTTATARRL